MKQEQLRKFITDLTVGINYNYHIGPMLDSPNKIDFDGMNCELFVHIVLEEIFGLPLPKSMRSAEIFYSFGLLKSIEVEDLNLPNGALRPGDILLFASNLTREPSAYHLGVYLYTDQVDGPTIGHFSKFASAYTGDNYQSPCQVQPLTQILQNPHYQYLMGIRRVIPALDIIEDTFYSNANNPFFLQIDIS